MKALYIYNYMSEEERNSLDSVLSQLSTYVTPVDISNIDSSLKSIIRATPAIIFAPDYLQGSELVSLSKDSDVFVVSELSKKIQEDEENFYNIESNRISSLISSEVLKGIDEYTLSLINGGII